MHVNHRRKNKNGGRFYHSSNAAHERRWVKRQGNRTIRQAIKCEAPLYFSVGNKIRRLFHSYFEYFW